MKASTFAILLKLFLYLFIYCARIDLTTALFGWFGRTRTITPLLSRRGGALETSSVLTPSVDYGNDSNVASATRALVLMDAFCPYHGGYIFSRILEYPDCAVINVVSDYLREYLLNEYPEQEENWNAMKIPDKDQMEDWKSKLNGLELVGLYCESDSGLDDAERLREMLNVSCHDDPMYLPARRNKFAMIETVGKAGLSVPKQKLCTSIQSAVDFATELLKNNAGSNTHDRVVVKPFRGVASESVYLCDNLEDVENAWKQITNSTVFGSHQQHDSVLVQDFISGREYALDVVSRNGEHKVAAVWRYDKRPANGAPFCYFQTELVDSETDDNVDDLCQYIRQVLNTLGIRYGLSHNEVIMTATNGPVLVEVNHRQHNMDFCPLTMACVGYNALDMTLDAYLGTKDDWDMYPDNPSLRAFGCMAHLVNYQTGILESVNYLQDLSELDSVFDFEVYDQFTTIGTQIVPTRDIRSDAGWVQMINEDKDALQNDFEQIVEWMPHVFQVIEE